MRFLIPLSITILLSSSAFADQQYDKCIAASDGSNASWNQCGGDWVQREDDKLNAIWKLVYGKASGEAKKSMLAEQRLWNTFKEESCSLYLDGESFGREGQVLSFPACRAEVIAQRNKHLEGYQKALTPK